MASVSVVHMVSSLEVGGAERFAIDLSVRQQSLGCDAKILSFGHLEEPLVEAAQVAGVGVATASPSLGALFSQLRAYKKNTEGPIVFHIHSPAIVRRLTLFIPALSIMGVRFIYTRHGCRRFDSFSWRLIHFIARPFVHAITFVSVEGLEMYKRIQGEDSKKLHWIQNGVTIKEDDYKAKESANVRFAMVGRMVELKAQIHLLQAVQKLIEKSVTNIEVHLFGDGPEREKLEKFVKENNLFEYVTFHGMVMDRSLMIERMDVLVMCSETEGLSLAIMEAMANGAPVISTDVGDSAKLVLPGNTGELYDYGDLTRLEEYLKAYIDDPAKIVEHGENAKHHIRENYSLDKTNEQYMALYLEPC